MLRGSFGLLERLLPARALPGSPVTIPAIAENRDRQIDGRRRAVLFRLGLGKLHRPARVAILLAELGRLVFPVLRNKAFLDRLLLFVRVGRRAWRRRSA